MRDRPRDRHIVTAFQIRGDACFIMREEGYGSLPSYWHAIQHRGREPIAKPWCIEGATWHSA